MCVVYVYGLPTTVLFMGVNKLTCFDLFSAYSWRLCVVFSALRFLRLYGWLFPIFAHQMIRCILSNPIWVPFLYSYIDMHSKKQPLHWLICLESWFCSGNPDRRPVGKSRNPVSPFTTGGPPLNHGGCTISRCSHRIFYKIFPNKSTISNKSASLTKTMFLNINFLSSGDGPAPLAPCHRRTIETLSKLKRLSQGPTITIPMELSVSPSVCPLHAYAVGSARQHVGVKTRLRRHILS